MLVPSPVAILSSTSTVGIFVPRSTADSMLRLTPDLSVSSARDNPRATRSAFTRPPSRTMSSSSLGLNGRGAALETFSLVRAVADRTLKQPSLSLL